MDLNSIADLLNGAAGLSTKDPNLEMALRASAIALQFVADHQKAGTSDPVEALDRIVASDEVIAKVREAADIAEERKFGKR